MICEICGEKNSKFAVKCKNCASFLQNPVRVLNLFETVAGLIFNPTESFHKIILSERKNFSIFLALLSGIAITFDVFHFARAGEKVDNLILILFYITVSGPSLGIIFVFLISLILKFLTLFSTERISLKSSFAVLAYSMFPLSFSVFLLLPAILAVFGIYYFTESPRPENLKPTAFYVLFIVNFILKIYSVWLLTVALKHITGNFLKGLIFALLASICSVILLNLLTEAVKIVL